MIMGICFTTSNTPTPGSGSGSQAASASASEDEEVGCINVKMKVKEFRLAEVKAATRNFKETTYVGGGDFGTLYKGWVDEKTLSPCTSVADSGVSVSIKKLNSDQGFKDWQREVEIVGQICHPNIVRLLGFCCECEDTNQNVFLVYEFVSNGSLDYHLFTTRNLSWEKRLQIAIGAAKGLAFLHSSDKHFIHRDIKPSNILLDQNYNAKISGFELAILGPAGEQSHISTEIMGTYGYAAPEYVATGHLNVKCDVYGFGVVLLELMTGLRAHDVNRPTEMHNLVAWAKPILMKKKKNLIKNVMDGRLEGQYTLKAALKAGDVTLKCLETDPEKRPSMQQVLEALKQVKE